MKKPDKKDVLLIMVGLLITAGFAGVIYVLIKYMNVPLAGVSGSTGGNTGLDFYELMGVSFSVTFITTSLFGGLSDKSEKIYWISYPEKYLIDSYLNFNVLSSISFLCLIIQSIATLFVEMDIYLRVALFLASFIVGCVSIVILSYLFTSVFFRRGSLLESAETEFGKMAEDVTKRDRFEEAVIGTFNNTIEAAQTGSVNLPRVVENIRLLLEFSDRLECETWLRKLIKEMGSNSSYLLIQVISSLIDDGKDKDASDGSFSEEGEEFLSRVEEICLTKPTFDPSELLMYIYELRIGGIIEMLNGEEELYDEIGTVEPEKYVRWKEAGDRVSGMINNIDKKDFDNCLFLLDKFSKLPYDLLRYMCYNEVLEVWDASLEKLVNCVREKRVVPYRKIQRAMFTGFLQKHPGFYYSDYFGEITKFGEQLGESLHKQTAECIRKFTEEQSVFMIDQIKDEDDKNAFLWWVFDRIAETGDDKPDGLPLEWWGTSKPAPYNFKEREYYFDEWHTALIHEIEDRHESSLKEYRDSKIIGGDGYSYNISLKYYLTELKRIIRTLKRVREYEKDRYHSSLQEFIRELFEFDRIGDEDLFWVHYEGAVPGPDGWEDTEEDILINPYANIFDVLRGDSDGLADLYEALDPMEHVCLKLPVDDMVLSKRKELFYLAEHIVKAIKDGMVKEENLAVCGKILAKTYTLAGEVPSKEQSEQILSNSCILDSIREFCEEQLNVEYENDPVLPSKLEEMYVRASIHEQTDEPTVAEYWNKRADVYEQSLKALASAVGMAEER